MDNAPTFTRFYMDFFGDKSHQHVDLLPETSAGQKEHLDLNEKWIINPQKAMEHFDSYSHPCWCNPELIYADDRKGNEVWLHKRAQ